MTELKENQEPLKLSVLVKLVETSVINANAESKNCLGMILRGSQVFETSSKTIGPRPNSDVDITPIVRNKDSEAAEKLASGLQVALIRNRFENTVDTGPAGYLNLPENLNEREREELLSRLGEYIHKGSIVITTDPKITQIIKELFRI